MADIRLTLLLIINIITGCIIQTEINIAVGKSTKQSSTDHGGVSSRAVDGDTNSEYSKNSCSHTALGSPSWWCVDFVDSINIETMEIYNRKLNQNLLTGFEIRLSSTGSCDAAGLQSAELCYKDTTTTPQDVYTIEQCNQNTYTSFNGRFVFISVEGPADKTVLTLCEVKIFEAERNVAVGKLTNQISTAFGGESSRAVDGNTNSDFHKGLSCSHTYNNGSDNWWCIDLGNIFTIETVSIYNMKIPGNQNRLQKFEIKLLSSGSCDQSGFGSAVSCYKNTKPDVFIVKECNQANALFTGRFVFISVYQTELVLCEVQIRTECSINCQNVNCDSRGVCIGCIDGRYGNQCDIMCSSSCNNGCKQTGICNGCYNGRYGDYCNNICSDGCLSGGCIQSSGVCNSCNNGRYGDYCNNTCSDGCLSGGCIQSSGVCNLCNNGWHGNYCNSTCSVGCLPTGGCIQSSGVCNGCNNGRYGDYCNNTCSDGCLSTGGCIQSSGVCNGCNNGWHGNYCNNTCSVGCLSTGGCIRSSGVCNSCNNGWYGDYCNNTCSDGCLSTGGCIQSSGVCNGCNNGWYGDYCKNRCSGGCQDYLCDETGMCTDGCVEGKIGDNCTEDCTPGYYGQNCRSPCGTCANGQDCDSRNGSCGLVGCKDGFGGPTCEDTVPETSSDTTVIVTVVVVLVLLVVAIVVGVVFIKRRRMTKAKSDVIISGLPLGDLQPEGVAEDVCYANLPDNAVYQNLPGQQRSATCIDLFTLWDYIQRKKEKAEFTDEYKKLPKGLCEPYDICMNEVNRPKNRYKGICAFDHTRVKLNIEDDDPNSDYMNACYIKMYGDSEKKYIASQGPINVNINEFIRMIWDVDASKIVMVTNFIEVGVEKCLNYLNWPVEATTETRGKFSMMVMSEDVYAHFTTRQLKITKVGCDPRTLMHYHYTSWPDKGVPADVASVIEFRNKVSRSTSNRPGPMIVHCSAGIGRTGTYLALDYLIEEGKDKQMVDVVSCLSQMRHERINMVQTLEQYIFLHQTLVEWFLTDDTTATIASYHQVYQNMLTVNNQTAKLRLQEKYEMMNKVCGKRNVGEYSHALLPENKSKNRDPKILASNTARTYIQTTDPNSTDYINAVSLPSYKKKNGYILTQTPLPATVTDFWRLVLQSDSNTVIDLGGDNSTRKDIGEYIPGKTVIKCDPYTITMTTKKKHQSGMFNIITCHTTSESEEDIDTIVKIYQCNFWIKEQTTPQSATHIFSLLEEMNPWSNTAGPVVVHCLNGVDKGGLFCVMAAILERLTIDQYVSAVQTIMQLRVQRPQIIICYEQFKFCFDAVEEYLDNFATYANSC